MSEPFDPYRKWLGIPPKHQPPHDYRLLGIELFESDPDVIANAADQRMAHLKNFATGQHSELSQRLLNEIAAARVRLLNPAQKATYDAALQQRLAQENAHPPDLPAAPAQRSHVETAGEEVPLVLFGPDESGVPARSARPLTPRKRRHPWGSTAVIAGLGAALMGLLLVAFWLSDSPQTDSTLAERSGGSEAIKVERKAAPATPSEKPIASREEAGPAGEKPNRLREKPSPAGENAGPPGEKPNSQEKEAGLSAEKPHPPTEGPAAPVVEPTIVPPAEHPPTMGPSRAKLSEPDAAAQRKADAEIKSLYREKLQNAKTAQQKLGVSEELRRVALSTTDDPSTRFMLLRLAGSLAVEGEDLPAALDLVDQIGQQYEIDVPAMKVELLAKVADAAVLRSGSVSYCQQIIATARELSDESIRAANVDAAVRFLKASLPSARRLKDRRTLAALQEHVKEVEQLKPKAALAKQAEEKLAQQPNDPGANLTAGSWHCFVAGDWDKGLAHLAKGEDPRLADLARQDLAKPTSAEQQTALGDRWWGLSGEKKAAEALRLQARGEFWYRQALPRLSGIDRVKLEKRLNNLGLNLVPYALKFDGVKSCVVVRNFGYDGSTPITVEVIAKPLSPSRAASDGNTTGRHTLLGNTDYFSGLAIAHTPGSWEFLFHYKTMSSQYGHPVTAGAGGRFPADKFLHVAGVWDGKGLRLYVEGKQQGSAVSGGPHFPSIAPFFLGAQATRSSATSPPGLQNFFAGLMRGVRVSNSARYTQSFQPRHELTADSNTKLLFQFTEGKGNLLRDSSGNRLKAVGEIMGAEWVKSDAE